MPYYIRHKGVGDTATQRLVELTPDQAANPPDGVTYNRCSAAYAHSWVKNGHPHETPLYIDYGRIRYARDDY